MNLGDLHKVWEIKTLKRKPKEEEARKILENVAKQVQPIMAKHKWRVKLLSEFCPKNPRLLGLNVGGGVHVKLRLRRANRDDEFIPFNQVLDTMLHELCHNVHGPHNASFYNLWDEIRKECEDLINKGISGSARGFDLPGRRLGGFSRQPPPSSLRQTALAAAENRVRLGSLLPSAPKRLGGDSSMMAALSPVQAAAMAAERRLQDNIWCGSELYDESEEKAEEKNDETPLEIVHSSGNSRHASGLDAQARKVLSQKRRHGPSETVPSQSHNGHPKSMFVDLTAGTSMSDIMTHHHEASTKRIRQPDSPSHANGDSECNLDDLTSDKSTSRVPFTNDEPSSTDESTMWECGTCTLLNPALAPICELCSTQKLQDIDGRKKLWSCKFCTLDNLVDVREMCSLWRVEILSWPSSSYSSARSWDLR